MEETNPSHLNKELLKKEIKRNKTNNQDENLKLLINFLYYLLVNDLLNVEIYHPEKTDLSKISKYVERNLKVNPCLLEKLYSFTPLSHTILSDEVENLLQQIRIQVENKNPDIKVIKVI